MGRGAWKGDGRRANRPWCPVGGQPLRTGDAVVVQDGQRLVSCGCGRVVAVNPEGRIHEHRIGKVGARGAA